MLHIELLGLVAGEGHVEAVEGAGDPPAFRGTAYVVFEDLPLEAFGNRRVVVRTLDAGLREVVMLDAKLLGIEELPDVYMASVEFSGMIREDASAGPSPFREVWNMTKPVSGSGGWLVAGVQALQ